MKGQSVAPWALLFLVCHLAAPAAMGEETARAQGTESRLKVRQVSHGAGNLSAPQQHCDFNHYVLASLARMPFGGGYSVKAPASANLSKKAVVWETAAQRLRVNADAAQPSFCSGACYVLMLQAFQLWHQANAKPWRAEAWKACDVHGQGDGYGVWGRANANGPGFAKLLHDTGAGVNFSDLKQARRGDFLKFFWTEEIGCKERGHMVVFLGAEEKEGEVYIRYWSSNIPDGYSERSVPLSKMHHLIFSRITRPEKFADVDKLPAVDAWLKDMQKRSVPFTEVVVKCGMLSAPVPVEKEKDTPAAP